MFRRPRSLFCSEWFTGWDERAKNASGLGLEMHIFLAKTSPKLVR